MNWQQQWIDGVLEKIPAGSYRRRMEAELSDHLDSQCRALMEAGRTEAEAQAEALRAMGEPDKLREEYQAAWQRTLPGRLKALAHLLKGWAVGCAVMFGVHLLISSAVSFVWGMAIELPANSTDPQIKMIRDTFGNLNNSFFFTYLLPICSALIAGACYLSHKFRESRHPVWKISVGLSFHWTSIFTLFVWVEALDDHRTFWEELVVFMIYSAGYFFPTLALCVLLGVVFGCMAAVRRRLAAA